MGEVQIDEYVVDTLMPDLVGHDRQPSAFLVYLFLWRHGGTSVDGVRVSLREIAESTGLSRRSIQDALRRLHRRRLIGIQRETVTSVPLYRVHRPWRK